jgi:hypothetical protein
VEKRAATPGYDIASPRQLGQRCRAATHFCYSAEDARPFIAEVALYYACTLIASALSLARNADGEHTASI